MDLLVNLDEDDLEPGIATDRWSKLALMAAPFGHGFCFVQFLNSGYDEIVIA